MFIHCLFQSYASLLCTYLRQDAGEQRDALGYLDGGPQLPIGQQLGYHDGADMLLEKWVC